MGVPVFPSPSGTESADDQDDGGACSTVTAERPASHLLLKLDSVRLEDSDGQDDDGIFVGKVYAADDEASSGRRSGIVDSLGGVRGSDSSLSLSPTRRYGGEARAGVTPGRERGGLYCQIFSFCHLLPVHQATSGTGHRVK